MPVHFRLIASLRRCFSPRVKRLAIWIIISSGIAGAAKYTASLDTENSQTGELVVDQQIEHEWDKTEPWWNPDVNIDELTERYTGERPFRLVTLTGYSEQTAALQPSVPYEPLSREVGLPPAIEPVENTSLFQNTPVSLVAEMPEEISGSAEYVAPEGVFVSGELSGFLGNVVYLSAGEANFVAQFTPVPEPAVGGLLAVTALGFALRRRRR